MKRWEQIFKKLGLVFVEFMFRPLLLKYLRCAVKQNLETHLLECFSINCSGHVIW